LTWFISWFFDLNTFSDFSERLLFSAIFLSTAVGLNTVNLDKRKKLHQLGYFLLFAITYHSIYRNYKEKFAVEYLAISFLVYLLSSLSFQNQILLLAYTVMSFLGNLMASSSVYDKQQVLKLLTASLFTYAGIFLVLSRKIKQKQFFHLTEEEIIKNFWETKEGIILADDDLRIQYINENAKKWTSTGFRDDFLIGSKIIFPVPLIEQKLSISSKIELANDTHLEVKYIKAEWMYEPVYLIITKDITEQVKKNREATRIANLHAKLIENAGEGLLLIDKDGLVNYANPEALRMLELEESQLIGEFLPNVVHETSAEGTSVEEENFPVRNTYTTGEPCFVTFDLFWRKDGSYFFVEYHATPIYTNGVLEGAVMIFRNVNDRKAKEDNDKRYTDEILYLSNTSNKFLEIYTEPELYRFIATEIGFMTDGSCIIVNHYDPINNLFTSRSISGFEKYQTEIYSIIGRDLKDMVYSLELTDEAYTLHNAEFSDKIEGGLFSLKFGNLNHKICLQLEKITGTQSVYSFVLKYKGIFLGNIIILHKKNFLENKAMLEVFQNQASVNLHRRLMEKNLLKEKFRFDPLIRETSALYVEMRMDGTILHINPALENLAGYSNEEILGKNWWSLFQKGAPFMEIQEFLINVRRAPQKGVITEFTTRKGYKLQVRWDWIHKMDSDSGEDILNGLGLEIKV
jgi:PAS domain S-box-containing protein